MEANGEGQCVYIGCCGFPVARKRYYELFSIVELQNTFYNLPTQKWAQRLREEAPPGFIFSVKAWQVITHPYKSPTWRRLRRKPEGKIENYGWLRPTRENIVALEKTIEIAYVLAARFLIFQTPPSLPYTDDSKNWVKEFLCLASKEASAYGITVAWEPRGAWTTTDAAETLQDYARKCKIVHVTDILKSQPTPNSMGIIYTRLHGLNGEINYKYKYTDKDLSMLKDIVMHYIDKNNVYILFNNIYMFEDAYRFKDILNKENICIK